MGTGKTRTIPTIINRKECSAIFSARTRMLNVKDTTITGTQTQTAERVATKRKHRNIY